MIKHKYLILLTILIIFSLVFGYWFVLRTPLMIATIHRQQLQQLQQQFNAEQQQISTAKHYQSKIAQLHKQHDKLFVLISRDTSLSTRIAALTQTLKSHSLNVIGVQTKRNAIAKDSPLKQQTLTVLLRGHYPGFRQWLKQFIAYRDLIAISSIELTTAKAQATPLNVRINWEIYHQ